MNLCSTIQCTGCMACYNACKHDAISLYFNNEGFLYPYINTDQCVDCKICSFVCPIINHNIIKNNTSNIKCYAAWSKNSKIVKGSSSGGFFSVVSNWILEHNGVVYGASFDDDFYVRHIRVDAKEGLGKLRGSKYVQSEINYIFQSVKNDVLLDKWVLFTGTPCQVDGLAHFLGPLKENNKLITIDLVCHGVPSPLIFKEYKSYLESKYKAPLVSYEFRNKKWSWRHFNVKAVFANKKKYYGTWEEDVFLRGFLRNYILRPSCHNCKYANTNRVGDFTIGDYWGYNRRKKEKRNHDSGVSVILANNEKSQGIMAELEEKMVAYERNIKEAINGNEAFVIPFSENDHRSDFWNEYFANGFSSLIDKYLYPDTFSKSLKRLYKYGKRANRLYEFIKSTYFRIVNVRSR